MTELREKRLRTNPLFWSCLVLILFLAACGQQTPPDTRPANQSAIQDMDTQWSKAVASGDVDGAVSYYSDDASLLAPNASIVTTKAGIRAAWASLLVPGASISWQTSKVEVAASGDMGYSMGTYQSTTKDSRGNFVPDHGKYVEIWKKQADGKWKAVTDIFNSDLPESAPPVRRATAKKRSHRARSKRSGKHS